MSGVNSFDSEIFRRSGSPLEQNQRTNLSDFSSEEEDMEVIFHLPSPASPNTGSPLRNSNPVLTVPQTPVARVGNAANRQMFNQTTRCPLMQVQEESRILREPTDSPNKEAFDLVNLVQKGGPSSPYQGMRNVAQSSVVNRTQRVFNQLVFQEESPEKACQLSPAVAPTPFNPCHAMRKSSLFLESLANRSDSVPHPVSSLFSSSGVDGSSVPQTPALKRKHPRGVNIEANLERHTKRGLFAADFTSSVSSSSQLSRKTEVKVHPYLVAANQVAENMEKLEKDGTPFSLQIGEYTITITQHCETFTPGDYCNAYLVKGEGLEDEFFVLKVFKEEWRVRKPKKGEIVGEQEVEQYAKINERFADLNCIAKHFDLEILAEKPFASMTHGCHLVRYIPYKYPVPKYTNALAPQGSIERRADEQLKRIYERAQQTEDEALDLRWQNVGMDRDCNIVVIDPMTPDPDDEEDSAFSFVREPGLQGFAGDQKSERYQFLNPKQES